MGQAPAHYPQAKRWQLVGNAVSVAVARWIGERAAQPHRYKYILSAKDRCMDPGAGPRRHTKSAALSLCGWSVRVCLNNLRVLQGWNSGKMMPFMCTPTCASQRMTWVTAPAQELTCLAQVITL